MIHFTPTPLTRSLAVARFAGLGLLLCLPGASAWSQPAAPLVAAAPSPTFVIRGFDVVGENPLADGETTKILAPFLRADATIETLQKASSALEAALQAKGFALYRVVLPPQEVGKSVTFNIVKFVVGKVTVEGQQRYGATNIRASVPALTEGATPNLRELAVQTAIANESQGKQIQVALKESEEADQIDAQILVKESKPWSLSLSANNTGSAATGNDRITLAGTHSNVMDLDHQLTAAYTTSLERPGDVRQFGLNYRMPLYQRGGVASVSYTHSDVLGNFGVFNSTGAGQTLGLSYSHYLPSEGGYRGYFSLGLEDKQFDATQINGIPLPGQLMRRSRPLTLGYVGRKESDQTAWSYNLDLSANVPSGSGNDVLAYQSEDARITTASWRALRGGANYLASVGDGWLWGVRTQFQWASDALIAGEQFGLGGATSVRGAGERVLSGDNGLLLSTELTTRELAPGLRLLGFVDLGWLGNRNPNGNPKPASDSLSSAGIGLRYVQPSYSLTADYGRVMGGSSLPFVAGSGIPRSGDQKLHINLSGRF